MVSPYFVPDASSASNTKTASVLVADPEIDVFSPLVARLLSEGLAVRLATSVAGAKAQLESDVPDFALIELKYVDGNGFEIVEALANLGTTRVVVQSSYCNISTAVRAVKEGASDVLPKPMEVDVVLAVLLGRNLDSAPIPDTISCPEAVRIEHIKRIYTMCGANVSRTARTLCMHRRSLQRIMARDSFSL
ncbi:acid tolerance response regulator ActR -2 [Rhizobium gallicum bv. gallicum R602sp]|uniref:Acid tolerance response regulator ActR-2 n=2 Tax=Rhizobium/Agrobacterium group TaxID=227290 RepID=A0A0B4X052_9HYPH|nr:acid tolerance response regulator ActR -2 [Rhizobium gallicum bv. gallicum R602sp]